MNVSQPLKEIIQENFMENVFHLVKLFCLQENAKISQKKQINYVQNILRVKMKVSKELKKNYNEKYYE